VKLSEDLSSAMARAGCAGAVAGVWQDGARELTAEGPADWETRQALAPGTRLPVASVTKPIIATAAVRAWRAASIPLEQPLRGLLPDLAADWRAAPRLSLRHLLSHTSGLRPSIPPAVLARFAYAPDGLAQAVRWVVHSGQVRAPGPAWQYCNPGYALAGYALGVVSGKGLEAALRTYVFEPAGMTDTSFGGAQASGHLGPSPVRGPYPHALRPAGGLVTTVADLLSFAAFAVDDPTLDATGTPVASSTIGGRYGLGWLLRPDARYHFGDWGGFHSMLLVMPGRRMAVAMVANDDGGVALRRDLPWRQAGLRRPRLSASVHSGWSWVRLALSRMRP
jgi:CubicO group peptidase (beta-lactamase class C family)